MEGVRGVRRESVGGTGMGEEGGEKEGRRKRDEVMEVCEEEEDEEGRRMREGEDSEGGQEDEGR